MTSAHLSVHPSTAKRDACITHQADGHHILVIWLSQEEYCLEHNVAKAQKIDEWTAEVLTTSVVDDTFFILQKCGARALATGNLQCVCAILGQLNSMLAAHLRAGLEHKWKVRDSICHSGTCKLCSCQHPRMMASAVKPHRLQAERVFVSKYCSMQQADSKITCGSHVLVQV